MLGVQTDPRFQRLIENITDTVTVVNAAGEPVWTSASGRNDLGYEGGFWGGADLFSLVHPDDREQIDTGLVEILEDPSRVISGEVRLRRTDGEYSFIGFDATNHLDDLEIQGIVITARNIDVLVQARTEQERTDIELRKALDGQAQLIAGVSHEMRTPIHAIGGLSELVLAAGGLSVDQRHQVETVAREAEALRVLLDELLDLSKVGAGRMELSATPFSPAVLLDEVARAHRPNAEKKDLLLSVEIDPAVPRAVRGDEFRTRQILMNLCSNAVKYTDEGHIDLTVSLVDDSMVDGLTVLFEVADTGRGVPPEVGSAIFEPYAQARIDDRQVGTGIGLAISARLAEAMGGQLTFESPTNEALTGTTFRCEIPYERARRAADLDDLRTADTSEPTEATTSLDVLVVDDSAVNRMLAESQLELLGHKVSLVEDGADAITAVGHHQYDAVLMDWHMPGIDGLEATRRIRAAGHVDLPIIAVTASALTEDRNKCLAAGMTDYLTKPVSLSGLRMILEPWAGAAPVSSEPSDAPASAPSSAPSSAASSAASEEPVHADVIDEATVASLVEDLGGDAVRSLSSAFCSELPSWLSAAQEGIEQPDLASVRRTAHTLKSTAAMLGALQLAELSAEIEHSISDTSDASPDTVEATVSVVTRLVHRLVDEAPVAAAALSPLIDHLEAAATATTSQDPTTHEPTIYKPNKEMLAP